MKGFASDAATQDHTADLVSPLALCNLPRRRLRANEYGRNRPEPKKTRWISPGLPIPRGLSLGQGSDSIRLLSLLMQARGNSQSGFLEFPCRDCTLKPRGADLAVNSRATEDGSRPNYLGHGRVAVQQRRRHRHSGRYRGDGMCMVLAPPYSVFAMLELKLLYDGRSWRAA